MNQTSFVIDGEQLDLNAKDANTFKGFGYLSCNNSSRLLLDYKWEHRDSYDQILQILFGGKHPLMRMLKVEMGDDANTSSGTEPATMRSASETANVNRGAGFQLIADAKKIQPNLKTAILRWGEPGWLRKDWFNAKSADPDGKVPATAYEPMYQWYKQTIISAYQTYGFLIDYIDPDRNETKHPMVKWIKWFADRLENDQSEFPNDFPISRYQQIKIIAADQNYERDFGDMMIADPDLRERVEALGFHYNTDDGEKQPFTKLADDYHHEVWYSEGIAPMTMGKYRVRASNGDGIGGRQSGLDVANRLIKSYVKSRRSLYIFQPAVSAYYTGVNYSHKELINACRPWSGYYEVDNVGLQCMKHFTDFAKAGWEDEGAWRYLTSACDSQVGGTENLDHNRQAPSYMTLMAPDKANYSVIFDNDSPEARTYQILLKNLPACEDKPVAVWQSVGPEHTGDAYDSRMKQLRETVSPTDGLLKIIVAPHSIATATTLDLADDPEVVYHRLESPHEDHTLGIKSDDGVLYEDDFSYSGYPENYLSSRGNTPRFTADQGGAFEVVQTDEGNVMQQMITDKQRALDWEYSFAPNLTFGDDHWTDYEVAVSMKFDDQTQQNSPTGNYFGIGLREMTDVKGRLESAPYVFKVAIDGGCELIKDDQIIAVEHIDGLDVSATHQVTFAAEGNHLTATFDGQRVFDYTDTDNPHYSGRVKLGSGYYHTQIQQLTVTQGKQPHLIEHRVDDLDSAVQYTGKWDHVCGLGNTKWNRTLSMASADQDNVPGFEFDFNGSGFSLIGAQDAGSRLKVTVDGAVRNWNLAPQVGADRTENIVVHGLSAGKHHVAIQVVGGRYTLDAVDFLK
ncbi:glycoside hydrolase family 30 protein [Lentilactobacillus buchneri]|uniref:glycosyl hydrolase n=2 Tax=Lentilactobacillus buchneri TaxID=1581 RepID=UPI001291B640|nr:glycosyl hydrolase [Lentilactobacillus buchneri]MCT2897985.1 glycosyl hydrolase [Lentilactobacillus buchneri]MDS1016459.1 glycosyl hydrolase [Lentilactobacillus buchneri]MQM76772.1 glycosyl hydrolase [Lentilactobacillus buchneri]MQM81707.1 glycosyl hydrolase [Lentilactobacillus buchneri]MQM86795.1 glycosyl hydrolase [Lentilactobacillus buchneri]